LRRNIVRTHLLRTFYPSPAVEPDTGSAANDEEYDLSAVSQATGARAATPAPLSLSREDEYALGGYAGI
jgi:hypothetical protein